MFGRLRRFAGARFRSRRVRPAILMYHRIIEPGCDPWRLAVSPEHFSQQLDVLKAERQPFTMAEFIERFETGRLPDNAVAITFDDGYIDNYENALPRLERSGLSATLFLVTGQVGKAEPFWWDELAQMILAHQEACTRSFPLEGEEVLLDWGAPAAGVQGWCAWEPAFDGRHTAFLKLWTVLQRTSAEVRIDALARLRHLFGGGDHEADRVMTLAELERLTAKGAFRIEAHSVTHPALTALGEAERDREVRQSRADCEKLFSQTVPGFAYPYGDMGPEVRETVIACGFDWACSTRYGAVSAASDRYALPRMPVADWSGEEFARELRNL